MSSPADLLIELKLRRIKLVQDKFEDLIDNVDTFQNQDFRNWVSKLRDFDTNPETVIASSNRLDLIISNIELFGGLLTDEDAFQWEILKPASL